MINIRIDLNQLNNCKSNFENEKNTYIYSVYNSFSSGYVSQCNDQYVSRMRQNLSYHYQGISDAYTKINAWLTNYLNDATNLENSLINENITGSFNANGISYAISVLPKLNSYGSNDLSRFNNFKSSNVDALPDNSVTGKTEGLLTKIARSINDSTLNMMALDDKVMFLFDHLVGEGIINKENIANIVFCGPNGENYKVTLADGRNFLFVNENGEFHLSSISDGVNTLYLGNEGLTSIFEKNGISPNDIGNITNIYFIGEKVCFIIDGVETYTFDTANNNRITSYSTDGIHIEYDYDISEEEKNQICSIYGLDPSVTVDYIARTNIRGYTIPYYAINTNGKASQVVPINFSKEYAKFEDSILSNLSQNFSGVFISPWNISSNPEEEGHAGAYVLSNNGKPFMFVPINVDFNSAYYKYNTPLHEIGHAVESILIAKGKFDVDKWNELYEKYKDLMPQMPSSCYSLDREYTTTPNEKELFADAFLNYFQNRDELRRYMPDLCEFLDNIFR